MSDIIYRVSDENDEAAILSLFSAAFGKEKNLSQWSWEFLGGPQKALIVVAETDDRIVGHYAILPRTLKVGQLELKSGLVVDVMTHPSYGRRGIFSQCGIEAFRIAEKSGLSMLFGFPNDAAIRGHLKVGWTELGAVRVCARPLTSDSIVKAMGKSFNLPSPIVKILDILFRVLNKLTLGPQSANLVFEHSPASGLGGMRAEITELSKSISGSYPISSTRDFDWLEWRLSDPLDRTIVVIARDRTSGRMEGIGALRITTKERLRVGAVMDVISRNNDRKVCMLLTRELLRTAADNGCETAVALKSPAASLKTMLVGLLLFPTPRKLRFIVRSVDERSLPKEAMALNNWHITLLDHDVF